MTFDKPSPSRLPPAAPLGPEAPAVPPRWTSEALLGQQREALIEHRGEHYRLRLTAAGKLILTK
ncbi:MAG: hemin uptake protein HemP [Piscinibacter sp.]|nr:hemin uptake protein HemP [Piscinibacter sp.]